MGAGGPENGNSNGISNNRRKMSDFMYEGDSNENRKSAIKIQNTARLSCKLTIMILMV
jgi:hypothetical protein